MSATVEEYYNVFMQSPSGRKVLADMKNAHYYFSSTFDPDPHITALREGERNAVLRILTILKTYEQEKES